MKAISSIVIALVAIFSVFQAAQAGLQPVDIGMTANAGQFSVVVAKYLSTETTQEGGNHGRTSIYIPGRYTSPAFDKLDCITAIGVGLGRYFTFKRTVISRDENAVFTIINNDMEFEQSERIGTSYTMCSFIAPDVTIFPAEHMETSIQVARRFGKLRRQTAIIHPKRSVVDVVEAYISPIYSMDKPTLFTLKGINKSITPSKEFIFRNPENASATTGSTLQFSTSDNNVLCDVSWDGVLYKNSASATIVESGRGIHFTLGSPLNTANEILLHCYDLRGIAEADKFSPEAAAFLPTILEFSYDDEEKYNTYTIAVTPSRPTTDSFKTGFTQLYSSSISHFDC